MCIYIQICIYRHVYLYTSVYKSTYLYVFIGIELNPWEESRAYQSYKNELDDLPPNAVPQYPRDKKLIGLSMNAPNSHKLYIHYCTNCIGMMHFIHTWNKDVEEALNGNFNMRTVNLKFEKYKDTIKYLKETITEQVYIYIYIYMYIYIYIYIYIRICIVYTYSVLKYIYMFINIYIYIHINH
jgi:hypothetical protein